jgi:hypothetical protein
MTNDDEIAEALQQEYDPEECLKYFLEHNETIQKLIHGTTFINKDCKVEVQRDRDPLARCLFLQKSVINININIKDTH